MSENWPSAEDGWLNPPTGLGLPPSTDPATMPSFLPPTPEAPTPASPPLPWSTAPLPPEQQGSFTPTPQPTPRRKRQAPLLIALLAVAVVAAGTVGWNWLYGGADEPGVARKPDEAVREYLQALAAGDATTALLYGVTQPADTTFLTDDALARMLADHPLTDINVPEGQVADGPTTLVEAHYQIATDTGPAQVDALFAVRKQDRNWLLDESFTVVGFSAFNDVAVPLTLNGVSLTEETASLFPGVYTLGTANPMIAFYPDTFDILAPSSSNDLPTIEIGLSEEGTTRIQAAAMQTLNSCLTQKSLRPAGCGFEFQGSYRGSIDMDSISWTVTDGSDDMATVPLRLNTRTFSEATAWIDLLLTMTGTSDNGRYRVRGYTYLYSMTADFSDPDNIVITFE